MFYDFLISISCIGRCTVGIEKDNQPKQEDINGGDDKIDYHSIRDKLVLKFSVSSSW